MQIDVSPSLTVTYDEAGQGQSVVLLHAFPLSRAMWRSQVEALQSEFRVLAPDMRGFGGTSDFDGVPSIEQMADDVAALLQALNIREPVVVCGLSMGGYVALALARRHAEKLRALILADTRAEPDSDEAKTKRDEMIAFAGANGSRAVIEKMLPNLTLEQTRQQRMDVVDEITSIAAAQSPAAIRNALRALRDRPDALPGLAAIKVPTLVIVGDGDALTLFSMARTLADGIADAQFEVIQGAGHLSNMEQAEAFNRTVLQFLRSL